MNHTTTNALIEQRKKKLATLQQQGNAYPNHFRREDLAAELHHTYADHDKETLTRLQTQVKIAGRVLLKRDMGKASFIELQDMSAKIQVYLSEKVLDPQQYAIFHDCDLGDIVAIEGELFKTKTNALTVRAQIFLLLTKSLQPLPDKFHGLQDQEQRYRQRYVDLIVNENTRQIFKTRSQVIQVIRNFLEANQFLEVETPMMHPLVGGATAKPFVTHHNSLDLPLYLRIAPELYLKRLLVGGLEKVFEINRCFRNEGLSTRHNPEFTSLEFYQAYADYHMLMDFTENLLKTVTQQVLGKTQFSYQGITLDFAKPFARMTIKESLLRYNTQWSAEQIEDLASLKKLLQPYTPTLTGQEEVGQLQFALFEYTVEEKLQQPTFITAHPASVSPLARRNDEDPSIVDRFELFIAGRELANAFSELNDPADQAERFQAQVQAKAAGDEETMAYDQDYITALEYGLPPCAGEGIGIDRLVMLLTDSSTIRDVILFPQLRHKS